MNQDISVSVVTSLQPELSGFDSR